jgi:hypothetical protein
MKLQKTEKGRSELAPGVRTLGQRERTFLLLVDGRKTLSEISRALGGNTTALGAQLIAEGYVAQTDPPGTTSHRSHNVHSPTEKAVAKLAAPLGAQTGGVGADAFEGKRSLATVRMFLFDISERMFTRRAPELAIQFREALRNAKDRDSMLAVSREMLEEVERVAGADRADSISERLAMLLPAEV